MKNSSQAQPSQEAVETSKNMWGSFVFVSKISGAAIAVLLILMAIFLV